MSKEFRIGLVGAGKMGQLHLKKLSAMPQVRVVGFYDPNPNDEIVEGVQNRFQLKRFQDLIDLFSHCDAVVIATPTPFHYSTACKALSLRKHVLVEKPPCETLKEASHLESLAAEVGCVLQPGFLERYRFDAMLRKVSIPLGRIEYVEFQRLTPQVGREVNISVIDDTMIHDIDLMLSLDMGPVSHLTSSGYSLVTPLVDVATARVTFQGGREASLSTSRVSEVAQRTMRMITSDAFLSLNFLTNEMFYGKRGSSERLSPNHPQHLEIDPLQEQWLDFISRCTTGKGTLKRYPSISEVISLRDQIEMPLLPSRLIEQRGESRAGVTPQ